jgi:hypothetical protein
MWTEVRRRPPSQSAGRAVQPCSCVCRCAARAAGWITLGAVTILDVLVLASIYTGRLGRATEVTAGPQPAQQRAYACNGARQTMAALIIARVAVIIFGDV